MTVESKTRAFCNAWQSISMIYKDYARRKGISYNSLYILNAIQQTENCTQKQICEKTLLPKQTVNNVITVFFKSGYIELRELPENRRVKTIHLTEKGTQYADTLIPHIHHADRLAMEALSEEQQEVSFEYGRSSHGDGSVGSDSGSPLYHLCVPKNTAVSAGICPSENQDGAYCKNIEGRNYYGIAILPDLRVQHCFAAHCKWIWYISDRSFYSNDTD